MYGNEVKSPKVGSVSGAANTYTCGMLHLGWGMTHDSNALNLIRKHLLFYSERLIQIHENVSLSKSRELKRKTLSKFTSVENESYVVIF